MLATIQTVSVPIHGRANVASLGEAFCIEVLLDKYRHACSYSDSIIYIPSLNKIIENVSPSKLFVSRDGCFIYVGRSSSQVCVSHLDTCIRLGCIDAAIGKSYIAALYKNRVSVINFDGVEIAEIPVPDSVAADIDGSVNNAQLTAIYNDKAALTCRYYSRKKTVLIFDIRSGKLCNIVDNHTVSQDGRYLIDHRFVSVGSEMGSRLTVLDLDGDTVFDDIFCDMVGSVVCVGDYIIVEYRSGHFVVNNIKDSRSVIIPAASAVVTNDGYIAVVAGGDDPASPHSHERQVVHIFRLDDIPAVKWGPFRTGGLCLFADVNTVDAVYLSDGKARIE